MSEHYFDEEQKIPCSYSEYGKATVHKSTAKG